MSNRPDHESDKPESLKSGLIIVADLPAILSAADKLSRVLHKFAPIKGQPSIYRDLTQVSARQAYPIVHVSLMALRDKLKADYTYRVERARIPDADAIEDFHPGLLDLVRTRHVTLRPLEYWNIDQLRCDDETKLALYQLREVCDALVDPYWPKGFMRMPGPEPWVGCNGPREIEIETELLDKIDRGCSLLRESLGLGNAAPTRLEATDDQAALSNRQYTILQALHELGADSAHNRQSTAVVAVRAEGRGANPDAFKKPLADLSRRGLVCTKEGSGGGVWLTPKGQLVEGIIATRAQKL